MFDDCFDDVITVTINCCSYFFHKMASRPRDNMQFFASFYVLFSLNISLKIYGKYCFLSILSTLHCSLATVSFS